MTEPTQEELGLIEVDGRPNVPEADQSVALTQYILGNDAMVNKFIANMLGQIYDEEKNEIHSLNKTTVPVRIMNDYGITKYAGLLSQVTDKGVLHSNLKKDEVSELVLQMMIDVLCDIFVNSQKYDLDIENFDLLLAQIKLVMFTALKRPQDAGERRAINTRGKVIEHVMRREGVSSSTTKEPTFFGGKR